MENVEIRLDEAKVAQTAKHVEATCAAIGFNADADESLFLARELETILAREFEKKYPERKARKLVPISTEVDPGSETYTYRVYDEFGAAKVITDYAKDLPTFDALAREVSAKVVSLGGSYGYSVQELRAAAKAGKSLDSRKQRAAVRGFEKAENDILLLGDANTGMLGLLKAAAADGGNVPTVSIPADGTGSTKTWSTKTADQIIRDLDLLVNTVRTQSKGIHEANTVLLPLEAWGIANSKPYSTAGGSDKTVLAWWKANHPGVEVGWVNELSTAGAGATTRAMAYVRDPEMLEGHIPQPYEQFPPQAKGLTFSVPCHSRIGGVAWYFPLSAVYGDGI